METKYLSLVIILFLAVLFSGCVNRNFVPVSGVSLSEVWEINESTSFIQPITEEFNRTIHISNLNVSNVTVFASLSGTGNDFACLNENGTLFRSNTSC